MILLGKVLISEDILERKFACQILECKGACCVQGDAGAPLEDDEIEIIEKLLPEILPELPEASQKIIKKEGFWEKDEDGDTGTRCHKTGECVFVVYENGIASCGIERVWTKGKIWFQKPLSCHLYPIRAKKYGEYVALNYHNWDICSPACTAGAAQNVRVHAFLKGALIRKFGPAWYGEFERMAEDWLKTKSS